MKRKSVLKDELEKPSKEEYAVAKCLKFSAPCRQGKFQGNSVDYFMGSKIVDFLLESKWSSKQNAKNPLFTTRMSCVIYCARLLEKGFFHRVEKPEKKEKSKKNGEKGVSKDTTPGGSTVRKRGKKEGEEAEQTPKEDNPTQEEKKRKRKPPKLRLHAVQQFIDGPDLYVWIYDPVPVKTFIIGLLLVVGVIGVCLFPLWPPEIKVGIYYLSCAAIGFIGFIFALCIVRVVVFVAVWLPSLGKVSLWLLPNLTEDVGFVDSFKPLYKIQYQMEDGGSGDGKTKGEKKEERGGEVVDEGGDDDVEEGGDGDDVKENGGGDKAVGGDNDEEDEEEDDKNTNSSNGYEIVNPEDYDLEVKDGDEEEDDEDNDGEEDEEEGYNEEEEDDDDDDGDDDDDDDDRNPVTKKVN